MIAYFAPIYNAHNFSSSLSMSMLVLQDPYDLSCADALLKSEAASSCCPQIDRSFEKGNSRNVKQNGGFLNDSMRFIYIYIYIYIYM